MAIPAHTTHRDVAGQRRPDRQAHRRGFWLVAAAFTTMMVFTTIPTPMYPLYQQRDHFPTFMITVIFAAYGFGVMAGLYLAGHVSDYLGRRRVTLAAVVVELISAVIFVLLKDTANLPTARRHRHRHRHRRPHRDRHRAAVRAACCRPPQRRPVGSPTPSPPW